MAAKSYLILVGRHVFDVIWHMIEFNILFVPDMHIPSLKQLKKEGGKCTNTNKKHHLRDIDI